MYLRALFVFAIACSISLLTVRDAIGACCELRKIDGGPPTTQVRACDPATTSGSDCDSWLYEGTLGVGEAAPICTASEFVWYEEWDEVEGTWGPTTEARCEAGETVEL